MVRHIAWWSLQTGAQKVHQTSADLVSILLRRCHDVLNMHSRSVDDWVMFVPHLMPSVPARKKYVDHTSKQERNAKFGCQQGCAVTPGSGSGERIDGVLADTGFATGPFRSLPRPPFADFEWLGVWGNGEDTDAFWRTFDKRTSK